MPPAIATTNPRADDETILALHAGGKSTRFISTLIGDVHWTTIAKRLKYLNPRQATDIFKAFRGDILAETQRKLLMKTNDAGARDQDQIARAFKAYYDCERLERDKSTSNTSISIDIADRLRGALKRADKMRSPVCVGDRVGDNRDERS